MQNLDQEWRELGERYEQMSEEELQILANEAYELTDMARELLQAEIARRRLRMTLLTEPPAVAGGAFKSPAVAGGAFSSPAAGSPVDAGVAAAGVVVLKS